MDIQSRPRSVLKSLKAEMGDFKGKPQGPKWKYFGGEPSIASGAESVFESREEIYGEADHYMSTVDENERKQDWDVMSVMSYQSNLHANRGSNGPCYNDAAHMFQPGQGHGLVQQQQQ